MTKAKRPGAATPIVDPPAVEDTSPTVGEVVALPEDAPELPGFEMSEEPFDVENIPDGPQPPSYPPPLPTNVGPVTYESRIQVLEAYRYMGHFRDAPDWVDRNWLAHGDWDPLRQIEPGPALRVPLDAGVVLARIGDYICRQAVTIYADVPPEVRLEVWPAETFQKMFLPKLTSSPPHSLELSASPSPAA